MSITHYLDINTLLGDTFGQWLTAQGATFENAQDLTEATVMGHPSPVWLSETRSPPHSHR